MGRQALVRTLLAQTIAKFLDVPIAITDVKINRGGYVGEDVEEYLNQAVNSLADGILRGQRGELYL